MKLYPPSYIVEKIKKLWLMASKYSKVASLVLWKWLTNKSIVMLDLADHSNIKKSKATLRFSVIFFVIFVLWATFFSIDEVIHAQGQVMASDGTQIIQAADGGILSKLMVREGEVVQKGQILAVLEKDRAMAAYSESFGRATALRLTVQRLNAEIQNKQLIFSEDVKDSYPLLVATQMNLFEQKRHGFLAQSNLLKENLKMAEIERNAHLKLFENGDISRSEYLRSVKAANEIKGGYISFQNKYYQEASAELNKAEEDLNAQQEILHDRAQLLDHTEIKAPTNGIVKSIKVTTIGGVVRQGDEILQVFPTDGVLIVEAKIKPADMAVMKVGLPAKIKLDAFDSSVYGALNGEVLYISPDSLIEETRFGKNIYYLARIELNYKQVIGKEFKIRPGMTVVADIKNGDRTILAYLMKPIFKTLNSSMGER